MVNSYDVMRCQISAIKPLFSVLILPADDFCRLQLALLTPVYRLSVVLLVPAASLGRSCRRYLALISPERIVTPWGNGFMTPFSRSPTDAKQGHLNIPR